MSFQMTRVLHPVNHLSALRAVIPAPGAILSHQDTDHPVPSPGLGPAQQVQELTPQVPLDRSQVFNPGAVFSL